MCKGWCDVTKVVHVYCMEFDLYFTDSPFLGLDDGFGQYCGCWWTGVQFWPAGRFTHMRRFPDHSIGSNNSLSPDWRQAIIWTNTILLSIGPLGTNFSQNAFKIQTFLLKRIHLKISSGKCRSFCLSLSVLTHWSLMMPYGGIKRGPNWYWLSVRQKPLWKPVWIHH